MIPVRLSKLVEELQSLPVECQAYFNKVTSETVILFPDTMSIFEELNETNDLPEWEIERREEHKHVLTSGDFLELPDAFDIDEYHMMKNFTYTLEDGIIRNILFESIRGHGAFRRFKNIVEQYSLREDWFEFKEQAYKEIVIDWLNRHRIPYEDDLK
jgi:hypothetical protein